MKKLTASIVASALMISAMGINAFAADTAAATPKITVFGNESSPAAAGSEATFIVRLSDFSEVKGMDLKITSGGNVEFTNAATSDSGISVDKNNAKVNANEIHIVNLVGTDVQTKGYANITVTAKVNGADTINVTGTLAKNGKETIAATYKVGTAAVKTVKTATTTGDETVKATDGYFIPYGAVENGNAYVKKEKDGSFENVPADVSYSQVELPANGITTFGSSIHKTESAIQFGTYTTKEAGERGTLLFKGDWEEFKNYYITEMGFTVDEILAKVNGLYDGAYAADSKIDGINVPYGTNEITVYRVVQTKSMWSVKSKNLLQYAARFVNAKSGETYTAVGYFKNGSGITFSKNVVTKEYATNK